MKHLHLSRPVIVSQYEEKHLNKKGHIPVASEVHFNAEREVAQFFDFDIDCSEEIQQRKLEELQQWLCELEQTNCKEKQLFAGPIGRGRVTIMIPQ